MNDNERGGSHERVRFDVPHTIAGRVTFTGQTRGTFPDSTGRLPLCPVIRLEVDGREVEIVGYAKVLRESLIAVRPRVGSALSVEYLGLRSTRSGGQFKAFRLTHNGVEVSRGPVVEPADWGAMARDASGGQAEPELPADPLPAVFGDEGDGDDLSF